MKIAILLAAVFLTSGCTSREGLKGHHFKTFRFYNLTVSRCQCGEIFVNWEPTNWTPRKNMRDFEHTSECPNKTINVDESLITKSVKEFLKDEKEPADGTWQKMGEFSTEDLGSGPWIIEVQESSVPTKMANSPAKTWPSHSAREAARLSDNWKIGAPPIEIHQHKWRVDKTAWQSDVAKTRRCDECGAWTRTWPNELNGVDWDDLILSTATVKSGRSGKEYEPAKYWRFLPTERPK